MAKHPPSSDFLGNPRRVRACKHYLAAVEAVSPRGTFGILGIHIAGPQPVARQRLEAVHQVLDQGVAVEAAFALPVLFATLGNMVSVALWRVGLTGRPMLRLTLELDAFKPEMSKAQTVWKEPSL